MATEITQSVLPARSQNAERYSFILRTLLRNPSFMLGLLIVFAWTGTAILWPWLAPYPPFKTGVGPVLGTPSAQHLLGTDDLGRDVLSRVLAGSRDIMSAAPLSTIITVSAGTLIGLIAGYSKGFVDSLLMRTIDILFVFPPIIIALMIIAALGSSITTIILVVGLFGAPAVSRSIRVAALMERDREFIDAARMRGESTLYILLGEILPNILGAVVVESTIRLGYAVFAIASLSFLGVSLQPPAADWGLTITQQRIFLQVQPWSTLAPALALASLVVAVNLIADSLHKVVSES